MHRGEDAAAALLDQFCAAWQGGEQPSISATLASLDSEDSAVRLRLLVELIKVDLEHHWRSWHRAARLGSCPSDATTMAHPPPLETYFTSLFSGPPESDVVQELAVHEFRLRQRWGDSPGIDDYLDGFSTLRIADRRVLRSELSVESSTIELFPELLSLKARANPTVTVTLNSSQDALRRVLAVVSPFDELAIEVRDALAMHATIRSFETGEVLLRQGDAADSLLVIMEGSVEVKVDDGTRSHVIARLERHTIVGEMAILTGERRTATVAALHAGKVAVIARDKLEHIAGSHPRLGVALSELIADRIGTRTIDALYGKGVGNYRIGHRLGRGGMGIVYAATQVAPTRGRQVALKMLRHDLVCDRASAARFRQEADIVQSLCHPHIVRMFEGFPAYGTHFIALELCPGISLSDLIERGGQLPEAVVRSVVGQLAGALECAHAAGIAHRDLKPSNVLVRRDGIVKLTDFGLARTAADKDLEDSLTEARQIVGTPQYMAPEQFLGERGDARSDLYSLGIVAYEMLTGEPQLRTNRLSELARERLSWSLPAADLVRSGMDRELYDLLTNCLHQQPESRSVPLSECASWGRPIDWQQLPSHVWQDGSSRSTLQHAEKS